MLFNLIHMVLPACLAICFIIQMIYWWVVMAKPYYKQRVAEPETVYSDNPPVSVIICVQHDAYKLEENLLAMVEQDYPSFEVIVVNDNLDDDSVDVLKRLQHQYAHFYFTHIPGGTRNLSRKKLALTLGIKAAQYDTLLFTEADCRPAEKDWIRNMAAHFTDRQSIVLGFSVMERQKGLGKRYAAFDYFFTNIQILAMSLMKRPFGANGRNMGYSKQHFNERKGFSKYQFLQAGADDLFVNEIASRDNVAVDVSRDGLIMTDWDELYDWSVWKKKRSFTKRFYKKSSLNFWRIESYSRLIYYALTTYLIAANFFSIYLPVAVFALYLIRLFSQLFVLNKTAGKLQTAKIYLLMPVFDILQLFINAYFYLHARFKGKDEYTWNLGK